MAHGRSFYCLCHAFASWTDFLLSCEDFDAHPPKTNREDAAFTGCSEFHFFLLRRVNICCHLALERRGLVTGWSALEWDSLCLVSVSMNYPALFPTNTQGERSAPNTFSCFYTEPSSVLNEKHGE